MAFDLPVLRIALYGGLTLFSFILFCLCAARLNYTTHLTRSDPLNGGRPFYDPVIVELLVASLITMPWSLFIMYSIHTRYENKYVTTYLSEIIGLGVLWLFWIAGAAVATNIWGNLSFCQQFATCQILSALLGFSWLGWIILTLLLGIALLFAFANNALTEPLHGRWNPRQSQYGDNVVRV